MHWLQLTDETRLGVSKTEWLFPSLRASYVPLCSSQKLATTIIRPPKYRAQAKALTAQARKCSRDADVLAMEGKFEEAIRLLSEAKRLLEAV